VRTFATVLLASVLVAGCTAAGGPSAAPTPAPVTPAPDAATPAPATPAPTDAAMLIPATVTFDGTTCTYLGPAVVPLRSVIEWTFETTATTAEERASWELLVWDVRAEATWETIVAWAAENTLVQEPPWRWPPWSTDANGRTVENWAADGPFRSPIEKNLTLVSCGVKPKVLADGQTVYPAALIQVLKG
jgi:hypothetical protein